MILEKPLISALQSGITACYQSSITPNQLSLQPTHSSFAGTHTLVLFPLARQLKRAPAEIGATLGDWLQQKTSFIEKYEVAKGFLNLTLQDHVWLSALAKHMEGNFAVQNRQKMVLEIACPNTNKPLHLGHLRNSIIGDAVANILQAVGHEVKKVMHINDRGVHICQSMWAYQQDKEAATPAEKGIKGDHFVGDYYVKFHQQYKRELAALEASLGDATLAKKQAPSGLAVQKMLMLWEAGDKEVLALWKKMNGWVLAGFQETFKMLGLTFDKVYYESATYLLGKRIVEEGCAAGLFYKKEDGSIWIDLREEGLDEKLLLRGD
ncbi:MAG: arginine--tRNA ligase, partial [Bacteroidota bacterium]